MPAKVLLSSDCSCHSRSSADGQQRPGAVRRRAFQAHQCETRETPGKPGGSKVSSSSWSGVSLQRFLMKFVVDQQKNLISIFYYLKDTLMIYK